MTVFPLALDFLRVFGFEVTVAILADRILILINSPQPNFSNCKYLHSAFDKYSQAFTPIRLASK